MSKLKKEFPSDKIDINSTEESVTRKEISIDEMKYEDIVKGVATEIEHEVWLRVKKLNWSYRETAEYFNYTYKTIDSMLSSIERKVKKFKRSVKMRGGNFFF